MRDARNKASVDERKYAERLMTPDLADAEENMVSPPDWRPVWEYGQQALAEKSKDLEITAFIIEALLRLHSFAGLRDGFRLARDDERLPLTEAGLHLVAFAFSCCINGFLCQAPHSLFSLFLTTTGWQKECSLALPASLGPPGSATGSENGTLSRGRLPDRHVHQG